MALVILYHAGLGVPGGYMGVDVFFVISGYLISTLIFTELGRGEFRIIAFWERRVRRILPALVCVLVACIALGWYRLVPSDFDTLGRSVAYQALLISNVFFYRATNYFSSSETQPLLHTWSLAVEEQFYLLFPLLLAWLVRLHKRALFGILAAIAVASLGLCISGTRGNSTAAFYFLPYRAWELVLGTLLALLTKAWPAARAVNEATGWVGIALILFSAMTYGNEARFPGAIALLPCLGTALVIGSNSRGRTYLGRLLSMRPVVFVGLISYSLYLWHWPLLVFVTYPSVGAPSVGAGLAVVTASVVLATLSWKLVEMPFRQRKVLAARPRLFVFAAVVLVSLLGLGALIHVEAGFPSRLRPEALRYLQARYDKDFRIEVGYESAKAGNLPEIGRKNSQIPVELLVWGDSHAMALLHVIDVVCDEAGVRAVAATHSATAPLLGFRSTGPFSLKDESIPYSRAVVDFVRERHIRKVLLAADWNRYTKEGADLEGAVRTTTQVLTAAGATVFVMADVPRQPFEVPKALAFAVQHGQTLSRLGISRDVYRAQRASADRIFNQVVGPSVTVLDPEPLLTDDNGVCRAEFDDHAIYFDRHHLAIHGEMRLRPLFEKLVSRP